MKILLALLGLLAVPAFAVAVPSLTGLSFEQHLGNQVPFNDTLRDEQGQPETLANLANGHPLILDLGYFHCPGLCGLVRDDLLHALAGSGQVAGQDYALVILSIDPSETARNAQQAKSDDLARYNLPGARQGWHYLTATPATITAIAAAVVFHDRYDAQLRQFLHPSGIVFLTPDGIVSSYRLGVGYEPVEIRTGLTRARLGRIARAALPVLLLCFHFDPATGRYSLAIMKLMQVAGAVTIVTLGGTILIALRRERERR